MHRLLLALTAAAALPTAAAAAAPPQVLTAPGRVAVAVAPTRVASIDAGGATDAVPVGADGSVVALVPGTFGEGVSLVALGPDGRPDPRFGQDGVARPAAPTPRRFFARQLLRDGAGRLLVVGSTADQRFRDPAQLAILRLTPTGAVDPSYGTAGLTQAPTQPGSGDVAPDGSVVVAAAGASGTGVWDVLRFDASGRPDAGFGTQGVVRVAGSGARGTDARLLPDGRVTTTGASSAVATGGLATRLLPDGRPDPTFHGGTPAPIPFPQDVALRADGRLDVLQAIVPPFAVSRLTAAGEPDPAFGSGGSAPVDSSFGFGHLLARGDGGDLVWAGNPQPGFASRRDLALQDVTADGRTRVLREASIPFLAGETSFASLNSTVPPHGLQAGALLARADGGLLVLGGAPVRRYTGEGEGFSTVPLAAARLRADDDLDPAFGGPLARATVTVALDRQRAATAARTRRVRVHVRTSGPGTVLLRVRDGRRRVLAEVVTAVAGRATTAVAVPLTREGRARLTGRRPLRVVLGAELGDVVGARAAATGRGTLR